MANIWQRFRSWVLWECAIEQTEIAGLRVRASVPFSEMEEKEHIATVREALALLQQHEPEILDHARRLLHGIHICQFETNGATASYSRRTRLVTLNPVYLVGKWKNPLCTAVVLAHEVMHARVHEAGITDHKRRVEGLCFQKSIVTGRKCGAPNEVMEWLREEQVRAATIDPSPVYVHWMLEELESAEMSRFTRWVMTRRIRRFEAQTQDGFVRGIESHGL